MIICLLAEPRTGSTNLANSFISSKNFKVVFEPITNNGYKWFEKYVVPKNKSSLKKNILVKETFDTKTDFKKLINLSDKTIFLYRENLQEQIESWSNAKETNNWASNWIYDEKTFVINEHEKNYFLELKEKFRFEFLNKKDYFSISYEEIYYKNGITKIIDYLSIDRLDINFPYGKKYRMQKQNNIKLI